MATRRLFAYIGSAKSRPDLSTFQRGLATTQRTTKSVGRVERTRRSLWLRLAKKTDQWALSDSLIMIKDTLRSSEELKARTNRMKESLSAH